jgi:hypothetical protein
MRKVQQTWGWERRGVGRRTLRGISLLAGAGILSAVALAVPAQAVANPVHAVAQSEPTGPRGSVAQIIFNPSPAGSVNGVTFTPPAGTQIIDATGCESTAALPTASTYTCMATPGASFGAPITLQVNFLSSSSSGVQLGHVDVTQTDNTVVQDSWVVHVQDVMATQASVPVTANGSFGSTTFNPSPHGYVNFVTFDPPPGVTITGSTGCPQASNLPTPAHFICLSGAQFFDTPITLTYNVDPAAAIATTLSGFTTVGQQDGSGVGSAFLVSTPVGATKLTGVHLPEPSAYGQSSTVKVTVARDGSTGVAPTGTVQLVNAAGAQVGATQTLFDGAATFTLPATTAVGTQTLTAKYSGTAVFAASQSPIAATVAKAATKTKGKPSTKTPRFKADFKVTVLVKAKGFKPAGKVRIAYKGKVIGKGKVKGGKAVITIKKDLPKGKKKLVVKYLGSSKTLASKGKVLVTIV